MKGKPRVPFADIGKRITGFSTPVFGLSWNPPETQRDIVRRLVAFLEDRRALYVDYVMEFGPWVEKSVLETRAELTDVLKRCPEEQALTEPIRAMRTACRKFLDRMGSPSSKQRRFYPNDALMWQALGEMRGVFGLHLARLCAGFGVDVEPELAAIFPDADTDSKATLYKEPRSR
jgi:hypothetical protein